jgi:flagellar biosynthesis/type III secretory pathway ATPase
VEQPSAGGVGREQTICIKNASAAAPMQQVLAGLVLASQQPGGPLDEPEDGEGADGAGTPPPELAGRESVREAVRVCIERLKVGNPAKSALMVGLRGVGKTVLLEQMRQDAEASGVVTVKIEAPEGRFPPSWPLSFVWRCFD